MDKELDDIANQVINRISRPEFQMVRMKINGKFIGPNGKEIWSNVGAAKLGLQASVKGIWHRLPKEYNWKDVYNRILEQVEFVPTDL